MRSFRFWLSAVAIVVCLFNLSGSDPDNVVLYLVSIPVWLIEFFADVHTVHIFWIYLMTIATAYLLGWGLDKVFTKREAEHT